MLIRPGGGGNAGLDEPAAGQGADSIGRCESSKMGFHFPSEQAAMECLYLVTRSLDPNGTRQTRWAVRWKPALNAFVVTFGDRMPPAEEC